MNSSVLLCALLVPVVSRAVSVAPGAPDVRVQMEARDGSLTERRLVDIDTDDLRAIGAAWVRFSDAQATDSKQDSGELAQIELVSGDVLRGRVLGGGAEELTLELLGQVEVPISIEIMRSLVFPGRLPLAGVSALSAPTEGDRLYRRIGENLDRIDGAVEGFDADGIRFDSVLGSRAFAWGEVGALFVEVFEEQASAGDADGQRVVCDLVDGSRLRGTLERLDRSGCRMSVVGGTTLFLPIVTLAEVSLDDGSVAFLSDLEPSAADEGSPFGDDLGASWPHRMDRSVMGEVLASNGRTFTRGIGVHSPSRLTFALGARWDELRGLVAIDDQVLRLPERGSVVFRIFVDDKLAWESDVVRGGSPPVPIPRPLDLVGAKQLSLECDMSIDFAVADRANWLRMVLVKSEL